MSLTSLSNLYMGASINTFYPLANTVTVNTTLELLENGYTTSNLVKRDLEKKLVDVIQENTFVMKDFLFIQFGQNMIHSAAIYNRWVIT